MSHAAAMENPAAAAYESEYQRGWDKSEQRDRLEASWRTIMSREMKDGSFLSNYTEDCEWEESLSHILQVSCTGTADEIACAVVAERERLIDTHAKRKAFADSED